MTIESTNRSEGSDGAIGIGQVRFFMPRELGTQSSKARGFQVSASNRSGRQVAICAGRNTGGTLSSVPCAHLTLVGAALQI